LRWRSSGCSYFRTRGRDRRLGWRGVVLDQVLRRYPVATGAEGLVGERAVVIVRCAPLGRVRLRGDPERTHEEPVELGEEVRVEAVDGLTLVVARAYEHLVWHDLATVGARVPCRQRSVDPQRAPGV
jgi:hypothetical protein